MWRTDIQSQKPKAYILDMYPYPSGEGLHIGHPRGYLATDAISHIRRMQGHEVLHPMGWDAFGLPAENYAIKTGIHPSETTARNTSNFRRQLEMLGMSYDWSREINTSDPAYYTWTQWIFSLLFERSLAYKADGLQWFCPSCKTVLANEQVEHGDRCVRCESVVSKKALSQWFFKITDYADRLLADLDGLNWPEKIKAMQRNWIGRSEGAEVRFDVLDPHGDVRDIAVFTTRPDTLRGVTFLVVAPESSLSLALSHGAHRADVERYIAETARISEVDRMVTDRPKTGVFTGSYVINPLTGERLPVWVADYVLAGYGTGAIMAVPGHDERDYAFAKEHDLPIVRVVEEGGASLEPIAGDLDGCPDVRTDGAEETIEKLAALQRGSRRVQYKLRDWLISRQRYWGAPIPIVHCASCGPVAVPKEQLPVELPPMKDFRPSGDGRGPLANLREWVETTCPTCGGPAERETDTMDGFACSSWYFLRFVDPHNADAPFDPALVAKWLPVDLYVGGAEHAVMHLLYARFWTKVLYDAGLVPFQEPFTTLMNQGMILGGNGEKMSKSKGNVVNPDDVIARVGADALRVYEAFMGPFDQETAWSDQSIQGVARFLRRVYDLGGKLRVAGDAAREGRRHRLIARVNGDVARFHFNTIIAALMENVNELTAGPDITTAELETLVLLLAPFAPHLAEAMWHDDLGHRESVFRASWPEADAALARTETIEIPVQVNGKHRGTITVARDLSDEDVVTIARAEANVARTLEGMVVVKTIVVPNRLVNFVVRPS